MPIWAYIYLVFMCLMIPFGIYNHIKERKSIQFLFGEILFTISCFLIFYSFWNKNLSSLLGYSILPQTLFIFLWGLFSGLKVVKSEGNQLAEIEGFNKDVIVLSFITLSPIYIIGIKQSLKLLGS